MSGFESLAHERECWRALTQRRMPNKFSYTAIAENIHDRKASLAGYQSVAEAAEGAASALMTAFRPDERHDLALCDVGPGNAVQSVQFLKALQAAAYQVRSWLGLDFSSSLLQLAIERVSKTFPHLSVASGVWDFEAGPTAAIGDWRTPGGPIVLALLGHTLASPSDPVSVLKGFHDSCNVDDFLLIHARLKGGLTEDEIVSYYRKTMSVPAIMKPFQLLGIEPAFGELRLCFSRERAAVIGEFILNEQVTLNHDGESCVFAKGEKIECFFSRRFFPDEVERMLATAGWKVQSSTYDKTHSQVFVVSLREPDR